jgi:L-threonylcarbamoyladenylate synthase
MRTLDVPHAAAVLRRGGVIAYPTEGVWGLGCDPADARAVRRLLALKQREEAKGLILIAADLSTFDDLLDWSALSPARRAAVQASWPGPHTWIVPATPRVPAWVRGAHAGVAVRVSDHPAVVALCRAFGGALVSTSANRTGDPAPRRREALDPDLLAELDGVLAGETGGLAQATPIRDAASGVVLRP